MPITSYLCINDLSNTKIFYLLNENIYLYSGINYRNYHNSYTNILCIDYLNRIYNFTCSEKNKCTCTYRIWTKNSNVISYRYQYFLASHFIAAYFKNVSRLTVKKIKNLYFLIVVKSPDWFTYINPLQYNK